MSDTQGLVAQPPYDAYAGFGGGTGHWPDPYAGRPGGGDWAAGTPEPPAGPGTPQPYPSYGPAGTYETHARYGDAPTVPDGQHGQHGPGGLDGPHRSGGTDGPHGSGGLAGMYRSGGTDAPHPPGGPDGPHGSGGTDGLDESGGPHGPGGFGGAGGSGGPHGPETADVPGPRQGRRRRAAPAPAPGRAPDAPAPGRAPDAPAPGTGTVPDAPFIPSTPDPADVPGPAGRRGARRGARAGRDSWRRIVPQALVVAFLAGGTSAFVAADKSVRLTVDGTARTLHTFADDVDELLAAEGLGVGPHDQVAPGRHADLDDGDEIVVRYGRPLRLTLDGQRRQVWTTARTVGGALRQLGVRAEGAYLSTPRTTAVPRAGLTLNVRTERSVTFLADGRESTIRTNAATVQEALDQAGITLQGQDTTSVPPDAFPRDGQTVTVLRITGTREVREERIPYETEKVEDATLFTGTEVVERAGRPGARRVTYALRTVNGVRQKPRRIAEEIVREPVTQRVLVGTRPLPTSVAGADGLDWGALAHCESGGRPAATDASGTYGGLYQFDVATWRSLGGSGRPQDASAGEQTFRAKKLYVQRGASPWPHCGRRLYR